MCRRTWRSAAKMRGSVSIRCARCSKRCATWLRPAATGACCPTICRRGQWFTSRCDAGSMLAVLKPWWKTCASCCAQGAKGSRQRWCSTVARCSLRRSRSTSRLRWGQAAQGSKVHAAVDTLGHLLALHVTGADAQDRTQVAALAEAVQEITGEHVELAYFVVCRDFRQACDVGIQPAAGLFRWRRCAAESSRTPLWIDRQYV